MKTLKITFALILMLCMAACSPIPTDSNIVDGNSQSPTLNPSKTYSPIQIATPTPPEITVSPSQTPSQTPEQSDDMYFYTIDGVGNGKYPYAWTEDVPAVGPIEYGVLNSEDVKAIQKRLTQLGFYCSVANGSFNSRTLTAVNEFQDMIGMERTSYISQEFIDVIFSADGIKELVLTDYNITSGILEGMTVFIDAGHGGNDTGTASGALVEREITIEQSYRIKAMLEEAGARVFMIRPSSSQVSLSYRASFANYVVLSDIIDETNAKIAQLNQVISNRADLENTKFEELQAQVDKVLSDMHDIALQLSTVNDELSAVLSKYGNMSAEYKAKLEEKAVLEENAKNLAEQKSVLSSIYYNLHMGVSSDVFEEHYRDEIKSLTEYVNKIQYYKNLFEENIQDPSAEFTGLYVKTYDENGYKIIEPELEKVMDITGSYCENKYAFISVHVNGVDNAPNVNGTEIYIQSNGNGINKTYYTKYNTAQRTSLASSLKNAMDEVLPLNSGKETRIKYSDLFVLRESNVPSILLEMGYVTNIGDRVSMLTPEVRNKFAYSIYEGLCEYFLS